MSSAIALVSNEMMVSILHCKDEDIERTWRVTRSVCGIYVFILGMNLFAHVADIRMLPAMSRSMAEPTCGKILCIFMLRTQCWLHICEMGGPLTAT